MELSKDLKKLLVAGAALLMTASVIGTGNVANAKHRRYHYHTHRIYRRHARRHYRKFRVRHHHRSYRKARRAQRNYLWTTYSKSNKPNSEEYEKVRIIGYDSDGVPHVQLLNKHLAKYNGGLSFYVPIMGLYRTKAAAIRANRPNKMSHHHKSHRSKSHKRSHVNNAIQIQRESIKDINKDRQENGLQPLQESTALDKLAHIRAKQASQNFTHVDPNTGQDYYLEDANRLGINLGDSGENLSASDMHLEDTRYDGTSYYNHNGKELADNDNDSLMHHDTSSNPATNWGHRKTILTPEWKYVGTGDVKGSDGAYTTAEEFNN